MIRTAIVVVIVLGVGAFIINNVFVQKVKSVPQKKEVAALTKSASDSEQYRGQFKGVDGIHNVTGDAVVFQTPLGPVLRFDKFSATPGPDLVVYLSKSENIIFTKDLGSDYVTLGSLQKMSGEQAYTLPAKYKEYKSVVIWCRAFSILFGAAPIK